MDYTNSDAFAIDAGTGQRLHQQSAAVTTAVTDRDMNGLIWEVMAVIKAAGLAPKAFDKAVVASYTQLLQALRSFQGNFSSLVPLTGAAVLTAAAAGKTHLLAGAGSYTVTLPLASSVPAGATLTFAASAGSISVTRQDADQIFPNSNGTNTVVLNNGDNLTLVSSGAGWFAVSGTAVLGNALQSFGNSLAAGGYQRLPTGLIIQWGSVTSSSAGDVSVTFPIAFPVSIFSIALGLNAAGQGCSVEYSGQTISGFTASAWTTNSTRLNGAPINWIAIGR